MAQIFKPGANTVARVCLVALIAAPFLGLVLLGALVRSSYSTQVDRFADQPVPFSHKHHVGALGIDCRYCHTTVEKSAFAGIPPTHTCMTCHSQIWTNAAMLEPVRHSLASGDRLAWRRVNRLPDYVYFDHSIHIAKGVGCTTCHGDVDHMPLMRKARSLQMQWCLECHRDPEKYLRPKDKIFSTDWTPPADQAAQGRRLARQYHVDTTNLTDCSICHR